MPLILRLQWARDASCRPGPWIPLVTMRCTVEHPCRLPYCCDVRISPGVMLLEKSPAWNSGQCTPIPRGIPSSRFSLPLLCVLVLLSLMQMQSLPHLVPCRAHSLFWPLHGSTGKGEGSLYPSVFQARGEISHLSARLLVDFCLSAAWAGVAGEGGCAGAERRGGSCTSTTNSLDSEAVTQ